MCMLMLMLMMMKNNIGVSNLTFCPKFVFPCEHDDLACKDHNHAVSRLSAAIKEVRRVGLRSVEGDALWYRDAR